MDFQKQKPIYLQIADSMCERMLKDEWAAQQKIPSIRELAVSMEVNPNTVTRSYSYLEELGVIDMKRGIGFFVNKGAKKIIITTRKKTFFERELPQIFKTMDILDISFKELQQQYSIRKADKF